jgi:excisionase family DNA binding protein
LDKSIASPREAQSNSKPDESSAQREVQPEWLTYRDSEILTGLSRVTLWKLIEAKEIKVARVGRAVRINRRSLRTYMEGRAADGDQGLWR